MGFGNSKHTNPVGSRNHSWTVGTAHPNPISRLLFPDDSDAWIGVFLEPILVRNRFGA